MGRMTTGGFGSLYGSLHLVDTSVILFEHVI